MKKLCFISISIGDKKSSKFKVISVKANNTKKCSINTIQAKEVIENNKDITFYIQFGKSNFFRFFNWIFLRKIKLSLQTKESNEGYEWREFSSSSNNNHFSLNYFREK